MAIEQDRGSALVHWLVVGRFGLPEGKTLTLTRADFDEALQRAGIRVDATVQDRIGTAGTRTIPIAVDSLKSLSLKSVIAALPELSGLLAKAEQVAKLKTPSVEDVAAIVGEGRLLEQLRSVITPPEDKPAEGEITGSVDKIFEKAEAAQPKTAKSAIDMFVRSTATSSRKKAGAPSARQLRDAIEEAAYGLASDVLRSEGVTAVESAWRGLRMLLTECPKDASMQVIVVEADPADVVEVLRDRERADGMEEPDCIFVPAEIGDLPRLAELADLAEQELIPIVVGVPASLFGTDDAQQVPALFEKLEGARNTDLPEWTTAWDELRMREGTRWLCTVLNRVVLNAEGAGSAKRTVLGSGVWAVAAMLAQSYRTASSFAKILGKPGAIRAPATHTLEAGVYADTATPTEAFYAIQPAESLARQGILALGSARNSDTIVLTKAPMVRGAKDAVPLSAQILTGRVVRFASWVRPQLPEGCDSDTANDLYMSAASVFLFPGQTEAAHVRASVTNIEGEAHVVVRAVANPQVAGVPFEIAFPLHLHWSVPAPETPLGQGKGAPKPSAGAVAEIKADPSLDKKGGVGLHSASVGFDAGLPEEKK